MKTGNINIDFKTMAKALREVVQEKAIAHGSTIVYMKGENLIEETTKPQ